MPKIIITPLAHHLLAVLVFVVWGSTFMSTRLLLEVGLSPTEIFALRASIAYVVLLLLYPKQVGCLPWRDEGIMALLGVLGGSFFFFVQNTALLYTQTTNVALLVCTAPLLTALLAVCYQREKSFSWQLLLGGGITLLGVAIVVFNGQFGHVAISLQGDCLAFLAAVSWAFYQLLIKGVSTRYTALLITRKVFFYGLITILPNFLFFPEDLHVQLYAQPIVWSNILLLSLIASLFCFWVWTIVVERIGAVRSAYYIYLNPIVAMIGGYLLLDEPITYEAVGGALLILGGVFCSEYKSNAVKIS